MPKNDVLKIVMTCREAYPFHYTYSGSPKYIYYLSKYLVKEGVDVEIVTSLNEGKERTEVYDNIKYTLLSPNTNSKIYALRPLQYFLFSSRLVKYLKRKNFDILHGYDIVPYFYLRAGKNVPVVYQPFGNEGFTIPNVVVGRPLYKTYHRITAKVVWKYCGANSDAIAAEGDFQLDEIIKLYDVNPEKEVSMKIFIIPLENTSHPKANVRLAPLIKNIGKNHEILGVERIPYFNTQNEILKHLKFFIYFLKVFYWGIKYRKKIDLILCEHLSFGLIGVIVSTFIRKPVIWDTHDGNYLVYCQLLNNSSIYTRLNLFFEKYIGHIAKVIIVPSELDKQFYHEQNYKYKNKVKVISSGIDFSVIEKINEDKIFLRKKLGLASEKKILISGRSNDFPPNKEAAFWINDELAQALKKGFKDIQIIITGFGAVPQNIHPIVTFAGYVQDYYEHILASDVCLVPYNMNTGISTKLIDYLACGRPTITTTEVVRLFPELVDGQSVVVARDRKEFIEKTIAILNNPELGEKIGANGREIIKRYYDMEVVGNMWLTLFETYAKESLASENKKSQKGTN